MAARSRRSHLRIPHSFTSGGLLLPLLALFFVPLHASAAIAFDVATSSAFTHATSKTLTGWTVSSGNNYTVVDVTIGSVTDNITSVTFCGSAMTQLSKSSTNLFGAMQYLYGIAGVSGTCDIVATFSGSQFIQFAAANYTGVAQSGSVDATASYAQNTGTDASNSVTTVADNDWTVAADVANVATNVAGTGTTRRANDASNYNTSLGDSNGPITPAASYTMHFTLGSSVGWKMGMIALKPASATPTATPLTYWYSFWW